MSNHNGLLTLSMYERKLKRHLIAAGVTLVLTLTITPLYFLWLLTPALIVNIGIIGSIGMQLNRIDELRTEFYPKL